MFNLAPRVQVIRVERELKGRLIDLNVFEMWFYPLIFYFNAKSILLDEPKHSGVKKKNPAKYPNMFYYFKGF